jgi:hypothetical protein
MVNSTVGYCDLNATATASITAFGPTITVIKGKLVLINGLNQIGGGTTKGVTQDTILIREAMTNMALKCANATMAYANVTNNNTLKALVNFTKSKLDALKKEDVDDVCEGIHDATDANIAAVAAYGVTAADVTDLQTAIGLYRTATQNPRQALISKSQAIKQAKGLVKDIIDNLLTGQLDVMVNTLKSTNPEFVSGYYQAREVIDLGSTSAKVRGTVLDVNDVPLRYVVFTLTKASDDSEVAKTETDIKGKFGVSQLPMGDFNFKWELEGYKTVEERDVHIGPGKEIKRKIVMEAAIVREGQFIPGQIVNVDLNGVEEDVRYVTVEAIDTNVNVFGSLTVNGGASANILGVNEGQKPRMTTEAFANATSFMQNGNLYLNVQNNGGTVGRWRITFER